MAGNRFSAAASALGYAYQFRYSLVEGLRRLRRELGWQIMLETADDIEVTGQNDTDLMQLKLRAPATTIANAGPELWKTLRVWSEGIRSERFHPQSTKFHLVTTAAITPGSIAAKLSSEERDESAAKAELKRIAKTSGNRELAASYSAFLSLPDSQIDALLESTVIIGNNSDTTRLDEELHDLCSFAVSRDQLGPFLERLEGWWFRRCLRQLVAGSEGIPAEDLDALLTELREQFRENNLPIDWDLDFRDESIDAFSDEAFVHQLRLLAISDKRVAFAVRDYLRAFTQRSRWAQDGLLLAGELGRYEQRLIEEWDRMFTRMCDELGTGAAEEEKKQCARDLYAWVESHADIRIRRECTEPFVTRGSYQILANELDVGWHPDFLVRLAAILEPAQ